MSFYANECNAARQRQNVSIANLPSIPNRRVGAQAYVSGAGQPQALLKQNNGIAKYSAEGRPFNPDLDLSYNRYRNYQCHLPPNLRGCPLNVSMEVARDNQIALDRARAVRRMSSPYDSTAREMNATRFSDSMKAARSNTSHMALSDDEVIACGQRLVKSKSPRARSCPTSLSTHEKYSSNMPRTLHKTADMWSPDGILHPLSSPWTVTTVNTNNSNTLATQSNQLLSSDTVPRDMTPPNIALRCDVAPQKDQSPIVDYFSLKSPLHTSAAPIHSATRDPGLENQSKRTLHGMSSTFLNASSTANELTFDTPKFESTRYGDDIMFKDSLPGETRDFLKKNSPHQTLEVTRPPHQIRGSSIGCLELETGDEMSKRFLTQCNDETWGRRPYIRPPLNHTATRSAIECSNNRKCGREESDSAKDEVRGFRQTEIRKHQLEHLVKDTYCPGIIQETLDGSADFNEMSFSISFGKNDMYEVPNTLELSTTNDPMTLLEAFSLRIEKDRIETNKEVPKDANEDLIEESIQRYFSEQYPSDLNRSIKSLLLSEVFAAKDHIAKEKSQSFTIELQTATIPSTDPGIVFVSYIGRTKPSDNMEV